ncbi:MAG: hypothetical protein IPI00_02155 [Flavobacteriales bacterium]|nr:hypothetical protein [Flavobacteriales bacterium]MBK6946067.1 hypothetical protein [Flavobacteriales bacterium]MBK7238987.1 hypothetical protein [Flavobacteriales bacterium]MBK7296831.1 hypothetical protein [Flavobacteriales bacterium]MBP9138981.1 hypothetical protein [Flavobacteriales bacterium]
MKTFSTSNSGHFFPMSILAALTLFSIGTIHAQDRLVVKGSFITQIADAHVHAVLIASDGTEMPIDLSRTGKYKVNAPASDTYVLRFAQSGCVTKEVLIDGRNANTKKFGERTIKFDMVLHADHPDVNMYYTGPVAEIAFEAGTGEMKLLEQYQLVRVNSFTAQDF